MGWLWGVICCRLTLTLFLSFLSSVRTCTEQTTHRYRHFYRHLREISRRPIIGTFRWARSYHKNTKIITPKTIWICSFTRSREVATYLCPLPCVLSGTERHTSAVRQPINFRSNMFNLQFCAANREKSLKLSYAVMSWLLCVILL